MSVDILWKANDIVVHAESRHIREMNEYVEKMRIRAEKSNTQIAWNEYHSAQQQLLNEIIRTRINV